MKQKDNVFKSPITCFMEGSVAILDMTIIVKLIIML